METLLDRLAHAKADHLAVQALPDEEEYSCPICGSSNREEHTAICEEDGWTS